MKVTVTYELQPASEFGLPQGGVTVVPVGSGGIESPFIHWKTGTIMGHGTLSQFRRLEERIHKSFRIGTADATISDNYAFVSVEVENEAHAFSVASSALNRFLQHLSVNRGKTFSYRPLLIETEDGRFLQIPQALRLSNVFMYNLASLSTELEVAAGFCNLDGQRLVRALEYYEYALFLHDLSRSYFDPFHNQQRFLVAGSFLNLWKSVTAITGDPSVRKDRFQARCGELSLGPELIQKIDIVKELRNNNDIAHYSLDATKVQEAEGQFNEGTAAAVQVIRAYRAYLQKKLAQAPAAASGA